MSSTIYPARENDTSYLANQEQYTKTIYVDSDTDKIIIYVDIQDLKDQAIRQKIRELLK